MNDAPTPDIVPPPAGTTTPPRRKRRPRAWLRLLLVLLFLGVIAGGMIWFHRFKSAILTQVVHQITSQLPVVATVKATAQQWQPELTATGTLRASNGADLSAEVPGIVGEIHFDSGQDVEAGQLLLRLRPNDDEAKLAQLQSAADLAQITYDRDLKQLRAQGVSQATVDSDAANLKTARAQVAAQQALMAEKFVRAPFAGRLGVRQVDLGQFLAAGTTIVTLQALDPIFADFYLPQQALAQLRTGQAVSVHSDTYPGRSFDGTITAISPKVDPASRMVQVRASVHNPDRALLPGMYITLTVASGAPETLVTVPQTAVTYNPYGSLVYKVRQDGTGPDGKPKLAVTQQFVTTGPTRGDQVAILKGVSAGDEVVVAGQIKLRNNIGVLVNNSVLPPDAANPKPIER
ncbi:MAG: efflux RND transporter periplasmic adaptor subunit [Proteobacteria bacterium]|nr:efflux RND transporter periplasmic adaptor subunit [Pseudomonadota bacterium]